MERAPLDVERLRAAVAAVGARWPRVEVVAETRSTNADLLARAGSMPGSAVLVAEHQVAGRGRLDRTWTSPPRAGLTVSVLVRPRVPPTRWGWLPLLAGVALRDAVWTVAAVQTSLKWPNDLLAADGRKLAGILAQTADDAVVIGIGLNVSTTADELPVATASSLALSGAGDVDRTALLIALLTDLDTRYTQWETAGADPAAIRGAYLAASSTVGAVVQVDTGGGAVTGEAVGIDELGRLVLRTPHGEQAISAGDVSHVRPRSRDEGPTDR